MGISLQDLELAFNWVSFSHYGMNHAWIHRATGATYYSSENGDCDEPEPEDLISDDWIAIPHKKDLGLGSALAFTFADRLSPEHQQYVYRIFRSKGAYRRFKELLIRIDELDNWHQFSRDAEQEAMIAWALKNQVTIGEPGV